MLQLRKARPVNVIDWESETSLLAIVDNNAIK